MFFLAHKTLHESSHVLSPEPLRFVWIWLGSLLFRILHITGATKGYHYELTLGFSHSSRSLKSTYLGCSSNFCLLHLAAIFEGSFVTICCILVAGLKLAQWMFSQYMLRELSKCFHPDLLISPGTYWTVTLKLELGFQIVQSAFHTIAQKTYFGRSGANKFRGTPYTSATINARNVATL